MLRNLFVDIKTERQSLEKALDTFLKVQKMRIFEKKLYEIIE